MNSIKLSKKLAVQLFKRNGHDKDESNFKM